MKWLRMLALQFEKVFEYKLKTLFYLFLPLINNLVIILFWVGAKPAQGQAVGMSAIMTYYVLVTICNLFLTSHTEYDVAELHIKQGELTNYLMKPISYFWLGALEELPYRILQASYALVLVGIIVFAFHVQLNLHITLTTLPLIVLIFILGYAISYTLKMNIAYLSFWMKDVTALLEFTSIVTILLSGSILPLYLYPSYLQGVLTSLPFVYFTYFPVMSIQGAYTPFVLMQIIGVQLVWFIGLKAMNNWMWHKGLQQYTAIGQ